MSTIKLFSDSTCDLSPQEIEQMDVGIVPLVIHFGDDEYREKVDIDTDMLFSLVSATGQLPKTASPSPAEYHEAFAPFVERGDTVLYIALSSRISSSIQNARTAALSFPEGAVRVVDSLNLCGGIGALVRMAHERKTRGMEADELARELEGIAPNYKLFFTMETLDYLYKGGRCSAVQMVMGSALGIRPIIAMGKDGLSVWKKARGKKSALGQMLEELRRDCHRLRDHTVHVASTRGNQAELDALCRELRQVPGVDRLYTYEIGCVIASHCGAGTIGFGYFLEEEA